ncbi:MAG: hypothetical protein ACI856_001191, partial [Kiritimatiellia bacterium]
NATLVLRKTRLVRMRWYDNDASEVYSEDDHIELIFNDAMYTSSVILANLQIMSRDSTGVWSVAVLQGDAVWGFGAGEPSVTNNPALFATNDSHFLVNLGQFPGITTSLGVDPTALVSNYLGEIDQTFPPVPFPRYYVGQDTDGDGLPDEWEDQVGLDPEDPVGINGAYGDPDRDGLINLYEYLACLEFTPEFLDLLNPFTFDTDDDGVGDYDSRYNADCGCYITFGEMYDDGDDLPDEWESNYPGFLSRFAFDTYDDADGDKWSNLAEYLYERNDDQGTSGLSRGTDPSDPASTPNPAIRGRIIYEGISDGDYHVVGYQDDSMDGPVISVGEVALAGNVITYTIDGFSKDSKVYLFAWKGAADDWEPGDPSGMADVQRLHVPFSVTEGITMTWSGVSEIDIPIYDDLERPWYHFPSWVDTGATWYYFALADLNGGNSLIGTVWVHAPRTWLTEADYRRMDWLASGRHEGLTPGNYQWQVYADGTELTDIIDSGTFTVLPYSPSTPSLIAPVGGAVVAQARTSVRWSMNPAPQVQIELVSPSGLNRKFTTVTPWRGLDGEYEIELPVLFGDGDYENGTYEWRMRSGTATTWSEWSHGSGDRAQFAVEIVPPPEGAPSISGEIEYRGKFATNLIVEAFTTAGFSGEPAARTRIASPSFTAPDYTTSFEILGLESKVYYVRAYLDMDNDAIPDVGDPYAVAREKGDGDNYEYWTEYRIGEFSLVDRQTRSGTRIVIRGRDTDQDNIPDYWENYYFGSLARLANYDKEPDGLTAIQEYGCMTSPDLADSDGDGLSDADEALLLCTDPANVDSDGDGSSDGAELGLGSDPRDPLQKGFEMTAITFDGLGNPVVQWEVSMNTSGITVVFLVEFCPNLLLPGWGFLAAIPFDGSFDGWLSYTNMTDTNTVGYYRITATVE